MRKYKYRGIDSCSVFVDLRSDGLSLSEIAEIMNVHPTTFQNWASKYPEFHRAFNEGEHRCFSHTYRNRTGRMTAYRGQFTCDKYKSLRDKRMCKYEIAEAMGVTLATLVHWSNKYPEFGKVYKDGLYKYQGTKTCEQYRRLKEQRLKKYEIANKMNTSPTYFSKWARMYPEFNEVYNS